MELTDYKTLNTDVIAALVTLRSMIHFGNGVPAINILESEVERLTKILKITEENYEKLRTELLNLKWTNKTFHATIKNLEAERLQWCRDTNETDASIRKLAEPHLHPVRIYGEATSGEPPIEEVVEDLMELLQTQIGRLTCQKAILNQKYQSALDENMSLYREITGRDQDIEHLKAEIAALEAGRLQWCRDTNETDARIRRIAEPFLHPVRIYGDVIDGLARQKAMQNEVIEKLREKIEHLKAALENELGAEDDH